MPVDLRFLFFCHFLLSPRSRDILRNFGAPIVFSYGSGLRSPWGSFQFNHPIMWFVSSCKKPAGYSTFRRFLLSRYQCIVEVIVLKTSCNSMVVTFSRVPTSFCYRYWFFHTVLYCSGGRTGHENRILHCSFHTVDRR